MKKELSQTANRRKYSVYIKSLIIELAVTFVFILLFAVIMYLTESGYEYASIFATVSIAAGTLAAAFAAAKAFGSKGLLTGALIGAVTFAVVTIISLITDDGGLTVNTLFHFIIIMLSSLIGGVLGVSRQSKRNYI